MSLVALLVGCTGDNLTTTNVNKDEGFEEEEDTEPPVIVHEAITETQSFGADVPIEATVSDEGTGVFFVYLKYKNEIDGPADWREVVMTNSAGVYSGTIRGANMQGGGVDYYIEAVDYAENFAYAPDDGADDPYHFRVAE